MSKLSHFYFVHSAWIEIQIGVQSQESFFKIHLDRLLLLWVVVHEMDWALWCDSLFVMCCVHHRHKCWAQGVFGLCWPCRLLPHNVLSHSVFLSCFAQNDKEQLCWIRGCFRKRKRHIVGSEAAYETASVQLCSG